MKNKRPFLLIGIITFILCLLPLFSAVTLGIGTVINNTDINTTINVDVFPINFDILDINNYSITFYNLTYVHPLGCGGITYQPVYNYTTSNVNISVISFPSNCSISFELSACNSTNNVTFVNFTFRDQTNTSLELNATLEQASFNYYPIGYSSLVKQYNFTSSTINWSYPFCITPSDYSYYISYNTIYSKEGYSTGIKSSPYSIYTNTSRNETLYLLNSTNVVTFQVINSLSQQLQGVYVYVMSYLNDTILTSGYTDSGGIVQFLLNNGTTYRIYFSKSGYDTYSTILTVSDTFYTITLSGTGLVIVTPPDYTGGDITIPNSKGVTYTTKPVNTWLNNGTYYNFSMFIDSGVWNLSLWGFNLTDQDNNLINSTSSTNATGGTIWINASTSNYTRVIMNFYYKINNTTVNLQRVWQVLDLSDNQFSIKHTIDDATSYIGSGLFGITNRGLSFIVFFIIFIGAGVLSYRFGLTSPVAICGFIFAMIWFFDVSLGWIPTPINAIPHIATWLIAFVFIGFILREVSQ